MYPFLSDWISKLKRQEDVARIFHILERNRKRAESETQKQGSALHYSFQIQLNLFPNFCLYYLFSENKKIHIRSVVVY
jgi:hypothetical protein